MSILVIGHEDLTRESLRGDLVQFSFVENVQLAESEQAAEQMLSNYRPDIVFLDMQLPDSGAFRVVDRPWPRGVPFILCTTAFDRRLIDALWRHRVEYAVRPLGIEEVGYLITRERRPDSVPAAENLGRVLEAAISLGHVVRSRVGVMRRGRQSVLETADIAAVRYHRERVHFWTRAGVYEAVRPGNEIRESIDFSSFRPLHRNALISNDRARFGRDLNTARRWLRLRGLLDFVVDQPLAPRMESQNVRTARSR